MKHSFLLIFLLAPGVRSEEALSLAEVFSRVEAANPELAALRAEARAEVGRARALQAWPEIEVGRAWEKTPAGDRMTHWRAAQTVPFPGKNSLDASAARLSATAAGARARQRALALRANARALAARERRGDAVVARWTEQRAIVDRLTASLRARVAGARGAMGGGGSAIDLFSLEAERGRMDNMIRMEAQERETARLRLNALMARPPEDRWTLVPDPLAPPPEASALLTVARRENPALASAGARARAGVMTRRRARLEWAPDIGLMWDEQTMDGARGREAGVSLMLPIWGGARAALREASAGADAAAAEQAAVEIDVVREVLTEHGEVRTRLAAARAYETDILPASRSALELTRRQYEAGRVDFLRLLESLRSASQAEVEHQDALYEYARHWGMLETAVGAPLDPSTHGGQK